ncbi:hypothetical protein EDB85DRAFT_1891865 [Lactarius pseudohatsudake]|nr:hypothetical protein EDB85DRAFT_1891865 [Lactarius pseudohatsudake]
MYALAPHQFSSVVCQLTLISHHSLLCHSHIKKCKREQRECQGEIKYAKTRERRLRALEASYDEVSALGIAILDEHLTYDLTAADLMDFDAGSEMPAREPTPPSVTTGPSDDPKTLDFAIKYHPNSG